MRINHSFPILDQNSLDVDPLKRHDIPRHDIKRVSFQCFPSSVVQNFYKMSLNCAAWRMKIHNSALQLA